jgi:parvulin-like peptidyl-prolyl isomerase
MARKFSDDEFTKEEGGLLGNVKKGDLVKLLDDVVWKHKVGELFELPTDKGTYFIYVEKEKEIMVPNSKLDKTFINKLEKEYRLYVKKLRQNAYIEYIDKSFKPEG